MLAIRLSSVFFAANVALGLASPTYGYKLAARSESSNTVKIHSSSEYCLIVPKDPHTNIGDSEHPVSKLRFTPDWIIVSP